MVIILIGALYETYAQGGKNTPGEFYLGDVWFQAVKSGTKTVDIRAGNNTMVLEYEGKEITFFHKKDKIKVKVKKIVKYDSVADLIKKENALHISPQFSTKEEAEKNLKEFYTSEKVKDMGGLLAIHF